MVVALAAVVFFLWLAPGCCCHALSLAKNPPPPNPPRQVGCHDDRDDPNHNTNSIMTEPTATAAAAAAVPKELPRRIHYSPFLNAPTANDNAVPLLLLDPSTTAMIILNAPIRQPPSALFDQLWTKSSFHICADGGANRLYQATVVAQNSNQQPQDKATTTTPTTTNYRPDLITGDLDSLWPTTRAHYSALGVKIVRQYDQNYNDLDKSIRSIPTKSPPYTTCFVYGAFGGRFDQEMASMQALYRHAGQSNSDSSLQQIWLWSDQNAALLLQPHVHHVIYCPNYRDDDDDGDNQHDPQQDNNDHKKEASLSKKRLLLGEGPTCGLIPLGQPCQSVTTSGLKWNLDGSTPLAFGGLVSTSNRIVAPQVHVTCSHPLIFTVEVHANKDDENNDDAPW